MPNSGLTISPQYCVGFGISWLRQAVLEQGEKWGQGKQNSSPASPAYPSSIAASHPGLSISVTLKLVIQLVLTVP